MSEDLFKKIYRFDEDKQEYILEMSLNNFYEMFHEWDASAIRKKDLDPELVDYLVEAVIELPPKAHFGILFKMKQTIKDPKLEEISNIVFSNYFSFKIYLNKRRIIRQLKRVLTFLLLGFGFIFTAYSTDGLFESITLNVLSEGLFIGGWVFIWESISLLVFKVRKIGQENKRFLRILQANIYFRYKS